MVTSKRRRGRGRGRGDDQALGPDRNSDKLKPDDESGGDCCLERDSRDASYHLQPTCHLLSTESLRIDGNRPIFVIHLSSTGKGTGPGKVESVNPPQTP